MDRESFSQDEGQNNFLEPDPDSLLHDGLPDLSKYLFIHSSVDDAGLDPYEFRIFCHLRRRARERTAWPGMRSISEVTGISLNKVCLTIRSLQDKGFVTVKKRMGHLHQSNVYFITNPGEKRVPVENATPDRVPDKNTRVPDKNATEGYPSEGTPITHNLLYPKEDYKGVPAKIGGEKSNKGKVMKPESEPDPELPGTEDLADPLKKKPKGMPALSLVIQEALRMGLKESDGEYIYTIWNRDGFRTKTGPIKDWRAAMTIWHRNNWFPTQKEGGYKLSKEQREAEERMRRARYGS